MKYPIYVLLIVGLVGAWLLLIDLFENTYVIAIGTVILMSLLIALALSYDSSTTREED